MTEYMVITEIYVGEGKYERWYYGTWTDRKKAVEVAIDLGHSMEVDHFVIRADEAEDWKVQNLPR